MWQSDTHSTTLALAGAGLLVALMGAGCSPEYPNCDNDEDCHEGEFCVNGTCQQCRDDADCTTGQQCVGGRCEDIEGFCQSDGDCGDGEECQDNRCVTVTESTAPPPEPEPTTSAPCSLSPVYFAFDSSTLSSAARDKIQSNAQCIRERDMSQVQLVGHCDPRGTEEYNLALGERRARSVKKYLTSLGVSGDKLGVSSMGEEMADGTGPDTWPDDRRVELKQR